MTFTATWPIITAPVPAIGGGVPPTPADTEELSGHMPQRQMVEVGLSAGGGLGPSLRVSSRRDRLVVLYSFERVARSDDARLIGMVGAGLTRPIHARWEVIAVAMGGFDTIESPAVAIVPALGARAGIEWHPKGFGRGAIQLGVTAVVDLAEATAFGHEVGGTSFLFATLTAGIPVRARPPR